jgi:diaminopimelate decarboxylase
MTCPHLQFLRAAQGAGLVPEAISQDELAMALAAGIRAKRAILNGPAKWPERGASTAVHHEVVRIGDRWWIPWKYFGSTPLALEVLTV